MTAALPQVPVETVYACADGAPFPVVWEDPAHAALTFRWNQDHFPRPFPPLVVAIERLRTPGRLRALAEAGVPLPSRFRTILMPHGFQYMQLSAVTAAEAQEMAEACDGIVARCGDVRAVWDSWGLPRIRAACAQLQAADDTTAIATLADTFGYGNSQTGVAMPPVDLALGRLTTFLAEVVGPEAERLAYELGQGYPNDTLAVDQALWDLARLAERAPHTRAALLTAAPEELVDRVQRAGDADFLTSFAGLLDRYGGRATSWELTSPTWQERPAAPLALVRSFVEQPTAAPAAATAVAAQRRQALIAETEAQLPTAAARERFRALLVPMEHYVYVREGRALWQLTVVGSLHGALLRHGERLVRAGAIRTAEDVFFLLPDEIDGQRAAGDRDAAVQERRATWSVWAGRVAPATIGAGVAPYTAAPMAGTAAPPATALRGVGASRGTVTARARLITDPADAATLAVGEVLVCIMTTPEWTPLFAVAGALVTDSGGLLSHPAIAAREYGIPAVIGARGATTAIPDGALITVDGTTGTITVLGAPMESDDGVTDVT